MPHVDRRREKLNTRSAGDCDRVSALEAELRRCEARRGMRHSRNIKMEEFKRDSSGVEKYFGVSF
jgi:hypothetical protein